MLSSHNNTIGHTAFNYLQLLWLLLPQASSPWLPPPKRQHLYYEEPEMLQSSLNRLWFLQAGAVEARRQALFSLNLYDVLLSWQGLLLEVWGTLQQGGRGAFVPGSIVLS